VFYGGRLLLKLFRRLEAGVNPDVEIGRFLTEADRFPRTPRVAGTVEYHRPGREPVSLAILQEFVPSQGDGWRHALDELGRYFERASGRLHGPGPSPVDERPLSELAEVTPPPAALATIGHYLDTAAALGRRTAELHLALAADDRDPAFRPEPWTPADAAALRASVREQARRALAALRENLDRLPQEVGPAARHLLGEG